MELIKQFWDVYICYAQELFFPLVFGFLLSGIAYEFMPSSLVEKYLGKRGWKPIVLSSLIGTLLPVCCVGSLPIAVTIQRKGATLGPVLAFLITTPATSISALIVTWKLLGGLFAVYLFFAVIFLGIMMGFIGDRIAVKSSGNNQDLDHDHNHQEDLRVLKRDPQPKLFYDKIKSVLKYAFIILPRDIGLELLIGIAIAGVIMVFKPLQDFIHTYLSNQLGYLAILLVSLVTYVCSTANVPLADALLKSGLSPGEVMTYLIVGPVTSYGTILVLKKEFGWKVMNVYVWTLCILAVMEGLIFDAFFFIHS